MTKFRVILRLLVVALYSSKFMRSSPLHVFSLSALFCLIGLGCDSPVSAQSRQADFAVNYTEELETIDSLLIAYSPYEALALLDSITLLEPNERLISYLLVKRVRFLSMANLFEESSYLGHYVLEESPNLPANQKAELLNTLALNFEYVGDEEECKERLTMVEELFVGGDTLTKEYCRFLIRNASFHRVNKRLKEAKHFTDRAIALADTIQYSPHLATGHMLNGFLTTDLEKRQQNLGFALKEYRAYQDKHGSIAMLIALAKVQKDKGEERNAFRYLDSAQVLAAGEEGYLVTTLENVYKMRSEWLAEDGKFEESLVSYKEFLRFRSQNDLLENQARMRQQQFTFALEREKIDLAQAIKDKEQLQQDLARQRIIRLLIVAVLILVIVAGVLLFRYLRQRNRLEQLKKDRLLAQKKRQLQHSEAQLAKAHGALESFKDRINRLSKEMEELDEAKSVQAEAKKISLREQSIITEEGWIQFLNSFNIQYPSYVKTLAQEFQSLSKSEKRYLILSKIHLDNREIAAALGVSVNSVHKTFSRIRQKTNKSNDEIKAWIKQA